MEKTVITIGTLKLLTFLTVATNGALLFAVIRGDKLFMLLGDCETPFTQEIVKSLSRLAWAILPAYLCNGLYQGYTLYLEKGKLMPTYDLSHVVLILCVFVLAQVFKFGAALQTQSDETL